MVIEVVAAEIGEACGLDGHAFVAKLREAVARRFIGDMRHAFAGEPGEVRQEGDDVGCGQPGGNAFVGRGDAQRADARRALARHAPDLARHFDGGGFPIGARDRNDMVGHGGEEPCCQRGEGPARRIVGDVDRAVHRCFGPRDHRHRPAFDRGRDEVFAIDLRALESAEDGTRRHLAIVDGKAGHHGVGIASDPCRGAELGQLHLFASGISGLISEMSTSRVSSGRTPINGPMRGTSRPTIGAAFHAAVRW